MYKVLKIRRCAVTSLIDLFKLETGTRDNNIFEDLALVEGIYGAARNAREFMFSSPEIMLL